MPLTRYHVVKKMKLSSLEDGKAELTLEFDSFNVRLLFLAPLDDPQSSF